MRPARIVVGTICPKPSPTNWFVSPVMDECAAGSLSRSDTRRYPPLARTTQHRAPHMISPFTPPSDTVHTVPGERAPAKHRKTHRLPSKMDDPSLINEKSIPQERQVKGIAVRFPSQSPHKAASPAVRAAHARKSLTLSHEIKTHTA